MRRYLFEVHHIVGHRLKIIGNYNDDGDDDDDDDDGEDDDDDVDDDTHISKSLWGLPMENSKVSVKV